MIFEIQFLVGTMKYTKVAVARNYDEAIAEIREDYGQSVEIIGHKVHEDHEEEVCCHSCRIGH